MLHGQPFITQLVYTNQYIMNYTPIPSLVQQANNYRGETEKQRCWANSILPTLLTYTSVLVF